MHTLCLHRIICTVRSAVAGLLLAPAAGWSTADHAHDQVEGITIAERLARQFDSQIPAIDQKLVVLRRRAQSLPELLPQPFPKFPGAHTSAILPSDSPPWVQLDLGASFPIEAVLLVGARILNQSPKRESYGFPRGFRVEVSDDAGLSRATTLAEFDDFPNPGDLPVFIEARGVSARYVRVTATRLAEAEGQVFFALGELMVLSDQRNLAETRPASALTSSPSLEVPRFRNVAPLIDGVMLGPPIGRERSPTRGWRTPPSDRNFTTWCTLDLGRELPLDEVRLVPAQATDLTEVPAYGFPTRVEIFMRTNDSIMPTEFDHQPHDAAPVLHVLMSVADNLVAVNLKGKSARFVHLLFYSRHLMDTTRRCAISEIQVYSKGENVALGVPVRTALSDDGDGWSTDALTDGYNSTHRLVDLTDWLRGLSQRREILHEIATLDAERSRRLARAAGTIERVVLAALSISVLAFGGWMWRGRVQRRRELAALRERISRDLHDEMGSNLATIGLISQEAKANLDKPDLVEQDLAEIQTIVSRTAESMQDIVRLVRSDAYDQRDLAAHLRDLAARLLRAIPHTLDLQPDVFGQPIPVDKKRDLVLMFSEALHNIVQHSAASAVAISLTRRNGCIEMVVQDNGRGFEVTPSGYSGSGLLNLQHRATRLGGDVQIDSAVGRGAKLVITFPLQVG